MVIAMQSAATVPAAREHATAIAAIAEFMHGYSLEATRPSADDVAELARIAPARTPVYVSAVPARPAAETIDAATRLAHAGFEPVPHIAVRSFATASALDDFVARVVGEAGVRRALVIAGDLGKPAGDIRSARDAIDGGCLARRGIVEIGVAGYPDGHPLLSQGELDRVLTEKIDAAESTGLKVHIVTQFAFDASAILAWITRLRDFGIEHQVRIGLAGPTSLATLLRFAQRCGVRASAQGLARQAGLVRHLFAMSTPDTLVRALAQANGRLGDVKPHFFSFGELAASARWAQAAAEGRIALDAGAGAGFRVEPAAAFR
jgi:methylenetetrahydrofolate reductase (NADH)